MNKKNKKNKNGRSGKITLYHIFAWIAYHTCPPLAVYENEDRVYSLTYDYNNFPINNTEIERLQELVKAIENYKNKSCNADASCTIIRDKYRKKHLISFRVCFKFNKYKNINYVDLLQDVLEIVKMLRSEELKPRLSLKKWIREDKKIRR